MYRARINKLRTIIAEHNASAFFVSNPKNIFYLSGFSGISEHERESSLLITQENAFLFVPRMYEQRAKHIVHEDITIIAELRNGLFASCNEYLKTTDILLCESYNLTIAEFDYMQQHIHATVESIPKRIEELRRIKDEHEIQLLRQAASITDKTFAHILDYIKAHKSKLYEQDVIDEMQRYSRSLGSDGFGFDPIIAIGSGSAEPHYISENKKIVDGQALLFDMGFKQGGYTSDMSRTIHIGKPTKKFLDMYNHVQACQQQCIDACKAGISTKELFDISFNYFKRYELEHHYLHSLGHGVGLDVHESPSLSPKSDEILSAGMVITIEPGLYFPGEFGIRIEDDLVITEVSYDILTLASKELLII